MATFDYTVGGAATAYPAEGLNFFHRRQAVVDFAAANTNGATRSSADILRLIDAAEGDFVLLVVSELLTAEGGTLTFDLGDGGDDDRYINAADGNTTAGTTVASYHEYTADATNSDLELPDTLVAGIFGLVGGYLYSADDTIDMVINNDADAAKIRVTSFMFNVLGNQTVANASVAV